MIETLIKAPYCYDYLVDQISIGLLIYSHIPTAIVALIFGIFLYTKTKNKSSFSVLAISICFALWAFFDLGAWFALLGSKITMFTWSLLNLFSILFFLFSYYFIYTFIKKRDLPIWQKIIGFALIIPTLWGIVTGVNLTGFDLMICEAYESGFFNGYATYVQFAFVALIAGFSIKEYLKTKDGIQRKKILLASIGILLFLSNFFLTGILVGFIYDLGIWEYAYNAEIYGLFGMPVFLIFIGYLIVKYHEFNIKIFTAQAFVIALISLVAAQFAFIHDLTSIILNTVTFILVSWVGILLSRNVKVEIELREKNENLAKNLQIANDGQENLIHIMNHQVKGYLGKARSIFAELLSEDEYKLDSSAKPLVDEGMRSLTEGVDFVQQILKGSSAESGKLIYEMKLVDLEKIVRHAVDEQDDLAKAKNLSIEFRTEGDKFMSTGDHTQLLEVIKNLINNSINYTEKGKITIELKKIDQNNLITIRDTGIGLNKEDMPRLFTKGGRGRDSLKYNVNSTGFGLAFAKDAVIAHNGRIWAESDGQGKGSTFYIELPLA